MKNLSLIIALIFAFTTTSFAQFNTYPVAKGLTKTQINETKLNPKFKKFNQTTIKRVCTDPAATAINFSLVRRFDQFRANVKIEGVVKNIGNADFSSNPRQQVAVLYEIVPGGRPVAKARRAFTNLAAGQSISVSFTRHWNVSSPAEGEFPPTYKVCVEYDPDIYIDGNNRNNDCNRANNCKERSGAAIGRLFRSPSRK